MSAPSETTLHASCALVGEAGVLVRGPSGAGKSRMVLALIEAARARGLHARLVADDRTRIALRAGRLVARPAEALAGLVERRGVGILRVAHAEAAVVRLVLDCLPEDPERLPGPEAGRAEILGVVLPRLAGRRDDALAGLALDRLLGAFAIAAP